MDYYSLEHQAAGEYHYENGMKKNPIHVSFIRGS